MEDNRVIQPVPSDFSYESGSQTSVQYLDQSGGANTSESGSFSSVDSVNTTGGLFGGGDASGGTFSNTNLGGASFDQTFQLDNLDDFTLQNLVEMFVTYAFIIAAALSAIFIFVGGINFILSGGNDEKVKQAINTIRYSIIGLIVTILSFTFVTIVGRIFGLDFMNYLSYSSIKASIEKVLTPTGSSQNNGFNIEG